jgi:hypothetical protein
VETIGFRPWVKGSFQAAFEDLEVFLTRTCDALQDRGGDEHNAMKRTLALLDAVRLCIPEAGALDLELADFRAMYERDP